MPSPQLLSGLSDIAADYDALFCDAWGVIHNGQQLFPGVEEALINFRKTRGPVIILTNAPRLSDVIPPQLDMIGLSRDAYDAVVTSGDATQAAVALRKNLPFYRLGPAKDDTMFAATGVRFVPLEEADIILCTGLVDDINETPTDYTALLEQALSRNLPMICANPDKVVKYGDRLIYCAGALGDLYETLGGDVILCGKPHPPIYALARRRARELGLSAGGKILCIGDGFQTDVLGANEAGLDIVYVADGIFSEQSRKDDGTLDPQKVESLLATYGVTATYALEGLRW